MADAVLQYGSILVGQRGTVGKGPLRVTPSGFLWRRASGGKPVEIKKADIESLHWTKVTRDSYQLGVRVKDGVTTNFIGFKDKDLESLQGHSKQHYDQEIKELALCTSGRNWGTASVNGRSLMFMVDGKWAFEVPLPDVAQAQQVKDDIMMEFHVDDAGADTKEDALAELALHVPGGPGPKAGQEDDAEPPAKKLLEALMPHTDTGAASADTSVTSFSDVHILAPRGRFEVDMMMSQVQLVGQAQDFKIRYTSIQRIFLLPKSSTPHTLVVISLDPPIRKGQTYYTHILCQFATEEQVTVDLDITPEQLAAKNEKCRGKLQMSTTGPIYEVFAHTLRGLSGAKITRPGDFKNATMDGCAIRCSYKADDGYLYPLDKAFFYVHKPPMLLPFHDVESVELTRLGGNTVSSKTFDLVVRTKLDTEHQFRGIQRSEWQVLLDFFLAKKLRVERLRETQAGTSGPGFEDDDTGRRIMGGGDEDDDEEDEDFNAENDSASVHESSDGELDEGGSDAAEMVDEEGISVKSVTGKKSKKDKDKPSKEGKPSKKRPASDDDEDDEEEEEKPKKKAKEAKPAKKEKKEKAGKEEVGKDGKKKRAKKDPNAPKGALSGFMYFSQAMREKVKADQPGIAFGEIGKVMGERWKAASPDEKAPFEEKAKKDKERYQREMAAYKAGGGGKPAADDDDGDGDEV